MPTADGIVQHMEWVATEVKPRGRSKSWKRMSNLPYERVRWWQMLQYFLRPQRTSLKFEASRPGVFPAPHVVRLERSNGVPHCASVLPLSPVSGWPCTTGCAKESAGAK